MKKYIYKRYYITCGNKYFCGTYIYHGYLFAIWGDKLNAKEYRKINSVNIMKEKLEHRHILGDHEDKNIEIEILERDFY